jgi:glutamate 5-kinase
VLQEIFAGREVGTFFLPHREGHLKSRKYWIAFTLRSRGKICCDEGAKRAILDEGKSLLPSGVTAVEGEFDRGDPVSLVDGSGQVLAKGLTNYAASEIKRIMGLKTSKIEQVLGYKDYDEIVHRDNMAVIGKVQ